MKIKVTNYYLGITWFIITTILLCLPGNQVPTFSFLKFFHNFDKLVHVIIFFLLSILFILPSINSNYKYFKISILSSAYGILMEFVQKYYIPNRAFDILDIAADMVGSFLAYLLVVHFIQKKKPL